MSKDAPTKSALTTSKTGAIANEKPTKETRSKTPRKKKTSVLDRAREAWSAFCVDHSGIARIIIALIVCALLWLVLWFLLFSGMNESADLIYAKF